MIVELEITAMAHGGSGIGRLEGRVIFCPGVIPGDVVRAEITDDSKKSLWRAQALSIITPSPHRVPHIWPEADISRPAAERAGGADYGHIALPHQRELKTHILKDSLMRFGGISEDVLHGVTVKGVPGDDEKNGLGWRTRVTLHADESGRLGPYAEKSHTVIPVKDLPLASDAIRSSGIVNTPFEGAHTVRALDTTGSGVRLVIDEQAPGDIVERVGEVEFHLSDQSFWQVHQSAPALLSDAVTRAIDPARLHADADNADLYSGVGLLGHAMAQVAGKEISLTAVESDERALSYVSRNLADVAEVDPIAARVDRWISGKARDLAGKKAPWSRVTIILDPPRSGAKAEVTTALASLGAGQIVYVACDPVALARDASALMKSGYEMVFLESWDLFPHTHHMETVATFVKDPA